MGMEKRVAAIRHPGCKICTQPMYPTWRETAPTKKLVGKRFAPHLIETFDLRKEREPGWRLALFLHALQTLTEVKRLELILDVVRLDSSVTEELPGKLISSDATWPMTHILGVVDNPDTLRREVERNTPNSTFLPNVVRVGMHLVWFDESIGDTGISQHPIIHMVASKTAPKRETTSQ